MSKTYIVMSSGCIVGVYSARLRAFNRMREINATNIEVWQDEKFCEGIQNAWYVSE